MWTTVSGTALQYGQNINRMVEIVLVAYLHDCDRFVCDVEKSLCVLWHRLTTPL